MQSFVRPLPCFLPHSPYPNQTAHRARKADYAVVEVGVAQRGAWYRQIAEVGNELQVRSRTISAILQPSTLETLTQYTRQERAAHTAQASYSPQPPPHPSCLCFAPSVAADTAYTNPPPY